MKMKNEMSAAWRICQAGYGIAAAILCAAIWRTGEEADAAIAIAAFMSAIAAIGIIHWRMADADGGTPAAQAECADGENSPASGADGGTPAAQAECADGENSPASGADGGTPAAQAEIPADPEKGEWREPGDPPGYVRSPGDAPGRLGPWQWAAGIADAEKEAANAAFASALLAKSRARNLRQLAMDGAGWGMGFSPAGPRHLRREAAAAERDAAIAEAAFEKADAAWQAAEAECAKWRDRAQAAGADGENSPASGGGNSPDIPPAIIRVLHCLRTAARIADADAECAEGKPADLADAERLARQLHAQSRDWGAAADALAEWAQAAGAAVPLPDADIPEMARHCLLELAAKMRRGTGPADIRAEWADAAADACGKWADADSAYSRHSKGGAEWAEYADAQSSFFRALRKCADKADAAGGRIARDADGEDSA